MYKVLGGLIGFVAVSPLIFHIFSHGRGVSIQTRRKPMYIIAQTINGGKTWHLAISREFAGKILRLVNFIQVLFKVFAV